MPSSPALFVPAILRASGSSPANSRFLMICCLSFSDVNRIRRVTSLTYSSRISGCRVRMSRMFPACSKNAVATEFRLNLRDTDSTPLSIIGTASRNCSLFSNSLLSSDMNSSFFLFNFSPFFTAFMNADRTAGDVLPPRNFPAVSICQTIRFLTCSFATFSSMSCMRTMSARPTSSPMTGSTLRPFAAATRARSRPA